MLGVFPSWIVLRGSSEWISEKTKLAPPGEVESSGAAREDRRDYADQTCNEAEVGAVNRGSQLGEPFMHLVS